MELGFLDEEDAEAGLLVRATTSEWAVWDGGLAGGPEPLWLAPPTSASRELVLCERCREPMAFLLQVYAPLDSPKEAFHRDLCVFYCAKCPVSPAQSAVCLRMQLPESNKYYPSECAPIDTDNAAALDRSPWTIYDKVQHPERAILRKRFGLVVESVEEEDDNEEVFDEDEDEDEDEEDEKEPRPCAVCKAPTSLRCSGCKCTFYCSRDHQVQHWTKGGHKKKCKELQDANMTQKDLDQTAAMGDAQTQSRLEKDAVFDRFVAKTKAYPDQVLRYKRWEGRGPLWVGKATRLEEAPPACERCGAERKFEMQITPQFLNHFRADMEALQALKCDIDFGTICLYTCTKSCAGSEDGDCIKEFAYCQPAA